MKKHSFFIVYTISCLLAYASNYAHEGKVVFLGSLQFPHHIKKVPSVRVYWAGHTIECDTNKFTKTINFNIPGLRQQRGIYLVIAKDIRFKTENNVILYLYLDKKTPYKFYYLELGPQLDETTKKTKIGWNITQLPLLLDVSGNFRLPDEAIVVYYPPKFIAGLEGGSALELPKINVEPDIVSTLGSESLLHDTSDTMLCAALTMDSVHRQLDKEIRPSSDHKTIITITT